MDFQTTLGKVVRCAGVGVHSGRRAVLTLKPAAAGHGIAFARTDLALKDVRIPARGDLVTDVTLETRLENASGASVSTVEHLLAALAGLEVDNALIEIDGPEVPIMDGSSAVFCELVREAGIVSLPRPRRRLRILETIEVQHGHKWARLSPAAGRYLSIKARIDFENPVIGVQTVALRFAPGVFAREIAFARTFGFLHEVDYLRARGMALGGSLDNAIVVDGDGIMNPEGLRAHDEFVRHKVLDAVGDLSLAGGPIAGHYEANMPGHALNNALVRKLLENPQAWCWEAGEEVRVREPHLADIQAAE